MPLEGVVFRGMGLFYRIYCCSRQTINSKLTYLCLFVWYPRKGTESYLVQQPKRTTQDVSWVQNASGEANMVRLEGCF